MSRRDNRPFFEAELGIPWDEYQFASYLACEGAVDQEAARLYGDPGWRQWQPRLLSRIADDEDVARAAADCARPASRRLRQGVRR